MSHGLCTRLCCALFYCGCVTVHWVLLWLTHCGLVAPFGDMNVGVNIGSGNGSLVSDGTNLLPEQGFSQTPTPHQTPPSGVKL